ncbi:MAG TPA: NIPSNAP family protein [Verrucomicrobiota bacterium]|nr:NIPSNAP family protein [Verrucomicrobiota bacterium]HNU49408.1 NIPSNAP family protein [Verrucomicrobiota bacterium]
MKRRTFLTLAGATSLAPLTLSAHAAGTGTAGRDFYLLTQYHLESEEQRKGLDGFLEGTAIPAWNRAGARPIGVFYPEKELGPVTVLARHKSLETLALLNQRLLAKGVALQRGAAFLDAPAEAPAFKRMESASLLAFSGMPRIETPVRSPGRVFQLRIYESPSIKTGQKKIEMFNTAEIRIFRKVGLNPVFFGEALSGTKLPNLTYMLVFTSAEEQAAAWKRFGADPDWQSLRAKPEYADKKILCGITNLPLKPAPYSQV